jgi:cellulose synthase/poly-beta-1,6-N-acetylglucosamine synthase-like glycosyltransferase
MPWAAALFWTAAGLILYVYFGYPLLLWVIDAVRRPRPIATGDIEASVTLIISAYNEEASIGEKLANTLALDYPAERLEALVVSDASSDRTDEIVLGFKNPRVRLLRMPQRGGKTVGVNQAVREARGDLLVFSDANALYYRDAIRALVRNFADAAVGAAVGESTYVQADSAADEHEGLYWKYEVAIKRLESSLGSVVGGDGAIYAIRRRLFRDMRPDAISDFVNPLQIVEQGSRVVYEPAARSYEHAGGNFQQEFRRKVRIVNRAWRATWALRRMLNPLRHGFFAFELLSHKLLRWLVPAFMVVALVSNVVLLGEGDLYGWLLAGQGAFYLLAALGWLQRNRPQVSKVFSIPYFFCLVNVASALGIYDAFRGQTYTTWTTPRAGQTTSSAHGAGPTA